MVPGDVVRVIYKGRPVFHGIRDKFTGAGSCVNPGHPNACTGWSFDETSPFTVEWDSRKHNLQPGRDSFIPFEAAASFFGDPRSGERIVSIINERGQVGFIPDRATEVRRLRTKYDNMFGDETVIENYPIVEVYDLQENERIITVLDDPKGDTVRIAERTVTQDNELVDIVHAQQKTINEQNKQLVRLAEQVGINLDGSSADTPAPTSSPVPDDAPFDGSEFPPEDDAVLAPTSESVTGERGGRPSGEPALDFSSLNAES